MKVGIETLDNGLRAAFVNMPHFRTTSARLVIHSGSLHEGQETAGAAHFLEHITFQGTEDLPTEQKVHEFSEEYGLQHNAFTSQANIRYIVDGYDPRSVGHFITQLAFSPSLEPETLEQERNPIVDELRGYASSPTYYANLSHAKAIRGDMYARPIGGSIEDVLKMTPENLEEYHRRNYRLGNAVLVVCSSESVESQRDTIEALLDRVKDNGPDKPAGLILAEFNPNNQKSSLQLVNLPLEAQTSVGINYGLPTVNELQDRYSHNLLASALTRIAHRRLRSELALCYGVSGNAFRLDNLHFGAMGNWAHLQISASLNGKDSIAALNSMRADIFQRPISELVFDAMRLGLRRHIDHVLEGSPVGTANYIADMLSCSHHQEIDLEDGIHLAQNMKVETLRALQKEITDQAPLITATSPDPTVLEKIGEWAAALS